MNPQNSPVLLRAYQILYRIVLATVIFSAIFLLGSASSRHVPFFILIILPVIVPFFVRYIFTEEKPVYFYIYSASLALFTLIYTSVMPNIGIAFLTIWTVEIIASLIIAQSEFPQIEREQEVIVQQSTEQVSPEATIQHHITKASREINRYSEKLKPLYNIHEKSQKYLSEVNERLNYPHLSESNKQTSLQLREMLSTSNENYRLMIRFFEEARLRYEREKRNLEEKLGNLRIIAFLNETDRRQEIAAIEKAALDIEFQKQLLKIENELPVIKAKMDAKAQLLSHDLKAELTETIERLKQG